jgi:hypothetical protein
MSKFYKFTALICKYKWTLISQQKQNLFWFCTFKHFFFKAKQSEEIFASIFFF